MTEVIPEVRCGFLPMGVKFWCRLVSEWDVGEVVTIVIDEEGVVGEEGPDQKNEVASFFDLGEGD